MIVLYLMPLVFNDSGGCALTSLLQNLGVLFQVYSADFGSVF